ncbi:hypothetical protein [Streptomyces sp. HD]|uniref:hypothetical protein n=1 Tax=Streptomyces sp. HD TaxID=3020892 RepID=UPI00232FC2A0|nr:hypothetical protein [Streptomyces sp. HD]MDC0768714.1 hypothetical protein [Streptomyces sp. HD]
MSSRPANTHLRTLLDEADWSYGALVRSVNAVGAELGLQLRYDRSSVSHWLSGTMPRPVVRKLIVEALSRRLGRAVSLPDAGFPDAPAFVPAEPRAARGDAASASEAAQVRAVQDFASASRRARGWQDPLPYRVHALVLSNQLSPSPMDSVLDGLSPADQRLREAALFFAASMNAFGGINARTALMEYAATDVPRLFRAAHGRQERRRAVLSGAARLAYLLARMEEDVVQPGHAQAAYAHAQRLAAACGDRATWGMALRAQSTLALQHGQPRLAVQYAEAAVATGLHHGSPHVAAFLLSQQAVAQATAGDHRQALATLTAAERKYEKEMPRTAQQETDPFEVYPPAALAFQRAQALEAVGDQRAATAALHSSLTLYSQADRRGRTLVAMRLAATLLSLGHLDECCSVTLTAMERIDELESPRAARALSDLLAALASYRRSPHVRAVMARARERIPPQPKARFT